MRRASFKCENCGNYSGLKQINRMKYGKVKIEKVFSPKKRSFFQVKDIYKSKEKERDQATANRVLKLKIKTWY